MSVSSDIDALLAQRDALVQFGRFALQSDELPEILTEACRLTSRTLGTDFAKVMELRGEGRTLRVVAGVGWDDGVVGVEEIPVMESTSEGIALRTGHPDVTEDVSEEGRFDYPGFLRRHGVEALVNVVIPGPPGHPPYGLLEVDSRQPREFGDVDVRFLQGYANVLGAAVHRQRQQADLAEALEVRERLLSELQHRVKNNLQTILSLLNLRSSATTSDATRHELKGVADKVRTLHLIYDQLHASGLIDRVDVGHYLGSLCSRIVSFDEANGRRVELVVDAEPVIMEANAATALGLIANEFATNSLKYAFSDGGTLTVVVHRHADAVVVTLADDGPGLGSALDTKDQANSGSGIMLIEGLARQMDATCRWNSVRGTRLELVLPATLAAKEPSPPSAG